MSQGWLKITALSQTTGGVCGNQRINHTIRGSGDPRRPKGTKKTQWDPRGEWTRALAEQFSEVGANCPHFPFYCIHFDHLSVSKRPRIWALGHKHPKPRTAPARKSPQLYFTKTIPCNVAFDAIKFIVVDVHDHKLFVFRVVAIMFASVFFPCSIPTGICGSDFISFLNYVL